MKLGKLRNLASLTKSVRMSSFEGRSVSEFIRKFNREYENKHLNYENNFWSTKMNLEGCNNAELVKTKNELDSFLGDAAMLTKVQEYLAGGDATEDERIVLKCFEKTFQCYIVEDPAALAMKEEAAQLEADLAQSRNTLALGYTCPTSGEFVAMSSVQLRNTMRTSEDEAIRKACYNGLRSIGPFVAEKVRMHFSAAFLFFWLLCDFHFCSSVKL